jgi:hypothetical protein
MHYCKSFALYYVIAYKQILSLDMLGFLVMFGVVEEINYAFVVAVERKDKRISVISLS